MTKPSDKVKATANETAGSIKQAAGKAVGNPRLELEGAAQKLKGEAQEAIGRAKGIVKKFIDKA